MTRKCHFIPLQTNREEETQETNYHTTAKSKKTNLICIRSLQCLVTVTVLWVVGWSAVCDCCMGWSYSLFCHQPAYDYTLGLSLCQVCNYFPFIDSCSSVAYPLLIYHLCTRAGPMTVIKCVMSVQGWQSSHQGR